MTSNATIKQKIRRLDEVPTLPTFFSKVMETIENERASASDLAGIISQDPALTSKILRLSNSAYYGRFKKVASVEHAVTTVGFNEVKTISLGIAVFGAFTNIANIEQIWIHAMSTASAVKQIGDRKQEVSLEKVYSGGLLHDVGKLVLAQLYGDEYLATVNDADSVEDMLGAEKAAFGAHHAQVGRWLAERWNFPAELVELISSHHHPLRKSVLRPRAVSTIYLADLIAHSCMEEEDTCITLDEQGEQIVALVGVSAEELEGIRASVRAEQTRIAETFALIG